MMIDSIELLNCRKLDCYPKTVFERKIPYWKQSREEQLEVKRFFYTNINSWIINADEIMRDSRYFLASVGFQTSLCPTITPCLGAFVEWWKYREQYSWTIDGMPIWAVCGNPMTGTSGCASVDNNGNAQRAILQARLIDVVKSFNRIAHRYIEAQKKCESYSLNYVLTRLPIKI